MVRVSKVMQLRNIDYFILKAIIFKDFSANTKEIIGLLKKYSDIGFVLTDSASLSRIYVRSRLVLLVDCGLLDVVKGKPNVYVLRDEFKSCVQSWVIGYVGILERVK